MKHRPTGPWVGADLEAGMYYGGGNATRTNNQSQPLTHEFVSLSLKGRCLLSCSLTAFSQLPHTIAFQPIIVWCWA
jgi:hypothetical protein